MMTDELLTALKLARYNDIVIANSTLQQHEDENERNLTSTTEHIFVATLDQNYGGIQWHADANVMQKSSSLDIGIQRHLQTKKWVMPMLKDYHRNNLYDKAIRFSLNDLYKHKQQQSSPQSSSKLRVLDIGSGTGLLAMMTHRHWTTLIHSNSTTNIPSLDIIGLEMSNVMARLANYTIQSYKASSINKCQENPSDATATIDIIEGHSCDHQFNNQLFDFCTCELLDSSLLGEGILPTIRDAWERHLHPDAFIVPQRARIYAQLIEGPSLIKSYRRPRGLVNERISMSFDNGIDDPSGIIVPIHAEMLFDDKSQHTIRFLAKPILALEFDFTKSIHLPTSLGRSVYHNFTASETGIADGVLFWWECDLYNNLTYSTEMGKSPWQDHWKQCLYIFNHHNCLPIVDGQNYCMVSSHDDFKPFFAVEEIKSRKSSDNDAHPCIKRPKIDCGMAGIGTSSFQVPMTPERSLQLNCHSRLKIIEASIEHALITMGQDASFLDLSDFSLCSIIAAVCLRAKKVTSIESSSGSLPLHAATVSQLVNHLPLPDAEYIILNAHSESILLEHIIGGPAEIVCCEPYYEVLEGWHLQEALNYFYILRSLKLRGIVCQNALCIPSFARIIGCAVELDESFVHSYSGIQEGMEKTRTVSGFNHDIVDTHCNRFHEYDMNFPFWQYKYKRLTELFEIARVMYEGSGEVMTIEGDGVWKSCNFDKVGKCCGFLYWVEYYLPVQQSFQIISTNDEYHFQSIRLLKFPVIVNQKMSFFTQFNVSPDACKDYDWSFRFE